MINSTLLPNAADSNAPGWGPTSVVRMPVALAISRANSSVPAAETINPAYAGQAYTCAQTVSMVATPMAVPCGVIQRVDDRKVEVTPLPPSIAQGLYTGDHAYDKWIKAEPPSHVLQWSKERSEPERRRKLQLAIRRKWRTRLSYMLGVVLLALVVWLVWRERSDVIGAWPYLRQANYWWLAAACSGALLYFALQGAAVSSLYRPFGKRPGMWVCSGILLQTVMLNEVVPTAGAAGAAGFVYWGDRLGLGLRDSVAVSLWYLFLSYLALAPLVGLCARALQLVSTADARLIGVGLETAAAVVAGTLVIFFAAINSRRTFPVSPASVVSVGARGRADHRQPFVLDRVVSAARRISSYTQIELSKEWGRARTRPWPFLRALLIMIGSIGIRVAMLRSSFAAVHVPVSLDTVLFAYAITQLFATVSPAPTTLGVVEIAYTASFSWFGLPVSAALAGTVLYRIASFWLPIPAGLCSGWWLNHVARRLSADTRA